MMDLYTTMIDLRDAYRDYDRFNKGDNEKRYRSKKKKRKIENEKQKE